MNIFLEKFDVALFCTREQITVTLCNIHTCIIHASIAMERQFLGPLNIDTGKEQMPRDAKPL